MTTVLPPEDAQLSVVADVPTDEAPSQLSSVAFHTYALSALSIITTAISGVVAARALGAYGRGTVAAVTAAPGVFIWLFCMGATQAVSYFSARRPEQAPALLSAWLLTALPCTVVGAIALELLLPTVLAGQGGTTLLYARIYAVPLIAVGIYAQVGWGAILGMHRYRFSNVAQLVPQISIALVYLVLWRLHMLNVATALVTFTACNGGTAVVITLYACRSMGLARPQRELTKKSFVYGLKAHGMNVGALVSGRLDIVILPAFVAATAVGLYAIATSVSWIVVTIAGSTSALVIPAAVRAQGSGTQTVLGAVRLTFVISLVLAAGLAVTADIALAVVYGPGFRPASAALRMLLPGTIFISAAFTFCSGLCAVNRPMAAAVSQLPGMVITLVGLPVFLPRGGIFAAAMVTSVAYVMSFLTSLFLYRTSNPFSFADLIPGKSDVDVLARPVIARVGDVLSAARTR